MHCNVKPLGLENIVGVHPPDSLDVLLELAGLKGCIAGSALGVVVQSNQVGDRKSTRLNSSHQI